jgi:hypothetical protein
MRMAIPRVACHLDVQVRRAVSCGASQEIGPSLQCLEPPSCTHRSCNGAPRHEKHSSRSHPQPPRPWGSPGSCNAPPRHELDLCQTFDKGYLRAARSSVRWMCISPGLGALGREVYKLRLGGDSASLRLDKPAEKVNVFIVANARGVLHD